MPQSADIDRHALIYTQLKPKTTGHIAFKITKVNFFSHISKTFCP